MVTNPEITVKMSKGLVNEVENFINKNLKNKANFPSKRNFLDRAVIKLLEENGVNLDIK